MDLTKYVELTGITPPAAENDKYNAVIRRSISMLETMLGFTLTPANVNENLYNEVGKSTNDCACPSVAIDEDNLADPDSVVTAYRLFPYNDLDQFLQIDPFTAVHKVKLVYVKATADNRGITLKTFDTDSVRVNFGRNGVGKYLEVCRTCWCQCDCAGDCVQLAVDADWVWPEGSDIPDELLYVLADMVTYYADVKRNIKSESITTHSYTKFENTPAETIPSNLTIIKKYAGPNGSVTVMPTEGASGRRVYPWV